MAKFLSGELVFITNCMYFNHFQDCVQFVKNLNTATEKIVKLLSSKHVFDVVEAIEFVKVAKKFGVAGSDAGILEMMKLISCPEESIRNCAIKAFEQLYLQSDVHANPLDDAYQVGQCSNKQ